ncbi:MAG: sensor histidine kinase [Chloroflexi bacterium]|nr:sensor histidine kinase [Chloroflexota bacterium]
MAIGTALHYGDTLPVLAAAAADSPVSLAYRQSVERILFLVPVMYAAYVFGLRGGLVTLSLAGAIMTPRALIGGALDHATPEVAGVMAVGALATLVIVQQQKDVETQRRMHEGLGEFVRQTLTAQEDERNRIALELHDDTAQALLVISQRLDTLSGHAVERPPIRLAHELLEVRGAVLRTLSDLRRISQGLRPRILDDHGLEAALDWLADQIFEEHGVRIGVDVSAQLSTYGRNTQLLLFRIAQEAARNVARHSGAAKAMITLCEDGDGLMMRVTDDGRGFSVPPTLSELTGSGRLGLAGMSERVRLMGGTFSVRSNPAEGSTIEVRLPRAAITAAPFPPGRRP